jgi:methionyl-tRNA formyltransferase
MSHRVIFCGTPDFAVPSLQALIDDDAFTVELVITQPDRPVGRKQVMTAPPVKKLALEKGIPVFQPENINLELQDYLNAHAIDRPDFLVVVAYGKILKQPILDLPKIAPINVHGSILPRWRGASPIEHAILNGDAETGVTIQIMTAGLDEGPILSIEKMPLTAMDTSTSVRASMSVMGATLLVETLKKPLDPKPQPDTGITICGKLSRSDGRVDTEVMTAEEIDRCIRALNPWPGVITTIEGHEVKIIEASLNDVPNSHPLECAKSSILNIVTIQEAGGKPMSAVEWKRGLRNK